MKYSQEFKNHLYELRYTKTAEQVATETGLTIPAVWKHWTKERLRRGDPPFRNKTPRHPLADEIYRLRGLKSAAVIAQEFGLTHSSVNSLLARERKRRGDPVLAAPPGIKVKHNGPEPKYPQSFHDAIYDMRGTMPASEIAKQFGLSKGAVCGMWRRERARRGDETPIKRKARPRKQPQFRIVRRSVTVRRRIDPAKPGVPERTYAAQVFTIREVVAVPLNDGQGVRLFDLSPCGCRYPLGEFNEPATFFCGSPAIEGKSYCGPHFALCTAPAVMNDERVAA